MTTGLNIAADTDNAILASASGGDIPPGALGANVGIFGLAGTGQVSPGGVGVLGSSNIGVWGSGFSGYSPRSGFPSTGVLGGGGTGVYGFGLVGVFGGSGTGGTGVMGSGGHAGVSGQGDTGLIGSGSYCGVYGTADTFGVLGYSPSGVGVWAAGDGTGVHGFGNDYGVWGYSAGGIGVRATSGAANSPALLADGYSVIHGAIYADALYVTPGHAKSAVVRLRNGDHRALYCMESPECWFEDFGRARLVRGKARVRLDRTFAQIVRTGSYHVFLSPEGLCQGLYVSRRTRDGFEVREQQRGASTVRFSYRIVARRKDVGAPRFKRVKLPVLPARPRAAEMKLPKLPAVPRSVRSPQLEELLKSTKSTKPARGKRERRYPR